MSNRLLNILYPFLSILVFIIVGYKTDRDVVNYLFNKEINETEKTVVLDTIKIYNKILTDFYASDGKPALLNQFPAIKLIRHHTFRDIGFLQNTERILVYDMADLVPVKIEKTSPYRAEAIVLELWNYLYQRRKDRAILTRPRGFGRGMRYFLIYSKGKWIIEDYEPVYVEEPEIKEFRF